MNLSDLKLLRYLWKREYIVCDRYAACYIDREGALRMRELLTAADLQK
ncbi:MAG: hypothetical protein NC432_08705 [Roseburia sp.]|nr:hypothetical protein [Roseburia sp.]MCM1097807.1 hypothetical protein [Ruminococcus flavefaciens]